MNLSITGITVKAASCRRRLGHSVSGCLLLLLVWAGTLQAEVVWPRVIPSNDGVPISYEIWGENEPALIFVHGWSCDARYWRAQAAPFAKAHRVITLDLAGHGHSGAGRKAYTMAAFGADVRAVAEASGCQRCILIGHSMGGVVIAEAARQMPDRVVGLIGVDTLQNIEYPLTRTELDQMLAPVKKDFQGGCRAFVASMMRPDSDPVIRDWILADMAAAPPAVALSAIASMLDLYLTSDMARLFEALHVPVVTVNADLWPINEAANRRHMQSFDALVLKETDHFLMLNRAGEFNTALAQAIQVVLEKAAE